MPEPEVMGLLALMLLHASRRRARTAPDGELILLDDQGRTLWYSNLIAQGTALVERALCVRRSGTYTLQPAIAAVHANATGVDATDWGQIISLYDRARPQGFAILALKAKERQDAKDHSILVVRYSGRGGGKAVHLPV